MLKYQRVGITVKSGLENRNETVEHIMNILRGIGVDILCDPKRTTDLACAEGLPQYESENAIDLLLVIGGDGTILRTVREMQDFAIPILSVNRGTVGFMAETELEEAEELLPKLLNGDGIIDERTLLHVRAMRGEKELINGVALNEAVIAQGTIARLVDLRTTVNGEPLTTFHADGLIISSPTGSTAYNLSSGGPIVHPSLDAILITPINAHSFAQKPVAIRGDAEVEAEVLTKETKFHDTEVILTLDGQVYIPLQGHDRVTVTNDTRTVKFLRRKQDTFFGTLREKLKWGERVD